MSDARKVSDLVVTRVVHVHVPIQVVRPHPEGKHCFFSKILWFWQKKAREQHMQKHAQVIGKWKRAPKKKQENFFCFKNKNNL
jgi:hypothetical protein